MTGRQIVALMRRHKVAIRDLARRTGITLRRIREVRAAGLANPYALRDWLEAITGQDPGPLAPPPFSEEFSCSGPSRS